MAYDGELIFTFNSLLYMSEKKRQKNAEFLDETVENEEESEEYLDDEFEEDDTGSKDMS
jgi:hypothetical protein